MKRRIMLLLIALALAGILILTVALLCRRPEATGESESVAETVSPAMRSEKLIGICLPSQAEEHLEAGILLKNRLEDAGYRVEIAYGSGTVEDQISLLNTLINNPVDCLVITPVDSTVLTQAKQTTPEMNIPILAYGSLLMDTEAVSGYIGHDAFGMGVSVARYIESRLRLDTAAGESRSYTLELFMGAPKDYNAVLLHEGILSVLETYINTGVLESKSGRLAFEDSCIAGGSEQAASQACANRLGKSYDGTAPDICICASDGIAAGVIAALEDAGCQPDQWPLITGIGATQTGMDNLRSGSQLLTVHTEAAALADTCVAMVDRVLFGLEPAFAVSEVFNNVVSVPTALCGFSLMDESN